MNSSLDDHYFISVLSNFPGTSISLSVKRSHNKSPINVTEALYTSQKRGSLKVLWNVLITIQIIIL